MTNYVQALSTFFREGAFPPHVQFSQQVREELTKCRENFTRDGSRLLIEPQPDVRESVQEQNNGRRIFIYTGSFIHAFEVNGTLYFNSIPNAADAITREDAMNEGSFNFLLDSSGTVIGLFDTITGNMYGVLRASRDRVKRLLMILITATVIAVIVMTASVVLR